MRDEGERMKVVFHPSSFILQPLKRGLHLIIEQYSNKDRSNLRRFSLMRDPYLAGILSLLIPGVGQLYNGRILAGILWLIITPGFWIGTGGLLGWICHIISAYTAYSYAKDHPVRV